MIRKQRKDHITHFNFCLPKTAGHGSNSKSAIIHSNLPSDQRLINHDSIQIPKPPKGWTQELSSASLEDESVPSCSNIDQLISATLVLYN